MAGLEQMIFPSGDVWMAAYIKDKSEHFELRTADHNGNGFRNLWNCTQPIGRSVEDFPYQEEKILRNMGMLGVGKIFMPLPGPSNDDRYLNAHECERVQDMIELYDILRGKKKT